MRIELAGYSISAHKMAILSFLVHSRINLNGLTVDVSLGCTAEERASLQSVTIDLTILFRNLPTACHSDQLQDTDCYDTLIKQLKIALQPKSFNLLEFLAHEIYNFVQHYTHYKHLLSVKVTKFPPIPGLTKGVSFTCGDKV